MDQIIYKTDRPAMEQVPSGRVSVAELIEKQNLEDLTPEIDTRDRFIEEGGVTRPALQLAGFFDYYNANRILIMGNAEVSFARTLDPEVARDRYDRITSYGSPCVLYTRGLSPDMGMITACRRNGMPLLVSDEDTQPLLTEVSRWLNVQLAPVRLVHGVLVDVYGEGVLIQGDSGIGKSEVALELIRRGHRLVADDAVELRKVSDVTLVGSAPDLTKYLLELRGIGVLDIREMFGVESVMDTQAISMVIRLEEWDGKAEFDRLGIRESYASFLDNRVPQFRIPIRPGRNVAILVESCAIRHRARKMGIDPARQLKDKLKEQGWDANDGDLNAMLSYANLRMPED